MMKFRKKFAAAVSAIVVAGMVFLSPLQASAAGKFDPVFYAAAYADVAAAFGTDAQALYNHYIAFGQKEGRLPYAGAAAGETVDGIADYAADSAVDLAVGNPVPDGLVPIDKLQNYTSLKKNMSDAEFQAAYDEAVKIVTPALGLSKDKQAAVIMLTLRDLVDSGIVSYSTSYPHYNDAYGYLINHVASCAGSTRTTGLCLNVLGINYEHVHENQWCHQWCRADLDGTIWVVDPYAYVNYPEEYPYWHPLADCGN